MTESPQSGWYSDPADPSRMRYWDGSRWTERTSTPEELSGGQSSAPAGGSYGNQPSGADQPDQGQYTQGQAGASADSVGHDQGAGQGLGGDYFGSAAGRSDTVQVSLPESGLPSAAPLPNYEQDLAAGTSGDFVEGGDQPQQAASMPPTDPGGAGPSPTPDGAGSSPMQLNQPESGLDVHAGESTVGQSEGEKPSSPTWDSPAGPTDDQQTTSSAQPDLSQPAQPEHSQTAQYGQATNYEQQQSGGAWGTPSGGVPESTVPSPATTGWSSPGAPESAPGVGTPGASQAWGQPVQPVQPGQGQPLTGVAAAWGAPATAAPSPGTAPEALTYGQMAPASGSPSAGWGAPGTPVAPPLGGHSESGPVPIAPGAHPAPGQYGGMTAPGSYLPPVPNTPVPAESKAFNNNIFLYIAIAEAVVIVLLVILYLIK